MKRITCWLTPLGPVSAHWENGSLFSLEFRERPGSSKDLSPEEKQLGSELDEYFAGKRRNFTIDPYIRGTDFQNDVWQALLRIPYGQTRTYADIAQAIQRPDAQQDVGAAVRQNPLPILIPCHRVVRSTKSLGGLSPKGIRPKLLRLEGAAMVGERKH